MPFKYNPYTGRFDLTMNPGSGTAAITFDADTGSATPDGSGTITFSGDSSGVVTSAAGNTVTLSFDVSEQPAIATSVATDSGTATPAANSFTIAGGTGLSSVGAGSTVTVNLDSPVSVDNGGTGSSSLTDGGILLGSGTSPVTVTSQPTDGQLLIGSTGVDPVLGSLTQPAAGITITGGAGSITFALSDDLAALEGLSGTGMLARTAANTYAERTITGGNAITVTNGDGVSGAPDIAADSASTSAEGVVELATTAEVTTGTSTSLVPSVAAMIGHEGIAKAWVSYDQTVPNVDDSYNVTSVTDTSAGLYTVNWDTDFAADTYACVGGVSGASCGNNPITWETTGVPVVGSITAKTTQTTTCLDRLSWVIAIGDQ